MTKLKEGYLYDSKKTFIYKIKFRRIMKASIKKTIILLTFLIIPHQIPAQVWEKIEMNLPPGDTLLSGDCSIVFATKNIGYLSSTGPIDPKTSSSGYMTKIYKTIDGGHNWMRKFISDSLSCRILYLTDSLQVFTYGGMGNLLFTTNGGESWETQKINNDVAGNFYFFNDKEAISITDKRTWFTSDGGSSWSPGDSILIKLLIRDFVFVNKKIGWIVSDESPEPSTAHFGMIAKSIDGGNSWQYKDTLTTLLYGVGFADSLNGFAVGTDYSYETGYIYSTINGGEKWDVKELKEDLSAMYDVEFLDTKNAWIVGRNGKIWHTNDGGNNWVVQNSFIDTTLRKIQILKEEKVAYVTGGKARSVRSIIKPYVLLRADLSNITGVDEEKSFIPSKYNLYQNYPNPFNPSTVISYQLPEAGLVSIKVYDILGRKLTTLVEEFKNAGKHSITWNGNNFASGIYFYRINFNNQTLNKKMLLVK